MMITFRNFDTRWDDVLLSMSKIPSEDVLESLYKLRIRESAQLKTALEFYDMDIHQKIFDTQISKMEDSGEEEYRSETSISEFHARGICYQWRENVNRTPSQRVIFSHICTHFILVHMYRMAQGVARRVCIKERSSTCHHVSNCALSLFALKSSSLPSISTTSLISSSPLSCSSSSMWSKPPSTEPNTHPHNEECCPVAIFNPLTGYAPKQLDNFDYSKTYAAIFQNESVDIDMEPSYSCDSELNDDLIGKTLSSTLFIREGEEPANLRLTYHSHEESLLPAQPFSHEQVMGDPCSNQFQVCLKTEIKSRLRKRSKQDSF